MARELPNQVDEFIRNYIDSLEGLEVLLLLSSAPDTAWTVQAVYDNIRSNQESIRQRLDRLAAQGLVVQTREPPGAYQYRPASPQLTSAVRELAVAYKERRVTVIEHIFAKPLSPIQVFADAFRIRREEKNDR